MSLREYLERIAKAAVTSPFDSTTGTRGPGAMAPEVSREFIYQAINYTVLLKECTNRDNESPVFEIPVVQFGTRALHAGTEGARLADANRYVPTRQLITMSTALFRAEMDVTPEFIEDVAGNEQRLEEFRAQLAERVGVDAEEIAIKSDKARLTTEDADLRSLNGIIKQLQANTPSSQRIDASTITTYNDLFTQMLAALPAGYKRDYSRLRFYVPVPHLEGYRRSLAARGTPLGDRYLTEKTDRLPYWGIDVVGVPLLSGTSTINNVAVDYGRFAILGDPKLIYIGWHRRVTVETAKMPWEGGIIGIFVSLRFDVAVADPNAFVLAYNLPATLS